MTDFDETRPYLRGSDTRMPEFEPTQPHELHVSIPATEPAVAEYSLPIRFTGVGSEYFGIWIVNLLLMLVTLGLYYPWAKVRRLRYFYGNTLVGNEPLDFHGNPKRMLRGTVLVVLLLVLYSVAGNFSPVAGLIALVLVAAIAPALVRAAMRFRMSNTSWRGLRFRFVGSMQGVYTAVLPLYLPAILIVGLGALVPQSGKPPLWLGVGMVVLVLLTLLVQPFTLWLLKRYQHQHYALGPVQTGFTARPGSFYWLGLKIAVVAMLVGSAGGTLLLFGGLGGLLAGRKPGLGTMVVLGVVGMVVATLALLVMVKPYAVSRLQNLVWNHTRTDTLQFRSNLRYAALLRLNAKNWLLVLLTLGLYWPFATIATTRLRLEAVTVTTTADPDMLVAQGLVVDDAAGDAAGDLFGFDLGI